MGVVVIGRGAREALRAPAAHAGAGAGIRQRHDPSTVLPCDVNEHVGLHGRPMLTAGAGESIGGSTSIPVHLPAVLCEATALLERGAAVAHVGALSSMIHQVIEHSGGMARGKRAAGTGEFSGLILGGLERSRGRSRNGIHPTTPPPPARPGQVFTPGVTQKEIAVKSIRWRRSSR